MDNLPIPIEYEGSVCEIKTMHNELVATGTISIISQKYIIMTSKHKDFPLVDYGSLIKVNVFNTRQGFRVMVGNVYTSTSAELSIVSIVSLVDHERRNFFRVDLELPANMKARAEDKSEQEYTITIKDMSLSGLRFQTKDRFAEGTPIKVELNLSRRKLFELDYRIVRLISEDIHHNIQYGCELVSAEADATDYLCSFLFQKQREFLNQRK